ncbi:hypothetical protein QJS04_geneDACA003063 [Acorus gramineus]|uniref:Uncharacterized protein n=1 Tax=Acorus gramineus TaxID=55184 RepID=A0AAV9BY15_ACOGR|nr:hypothetical protein QJS04_geneDACA003063 [Acorus gramineus]
MLEKEKRSNKTERKSSVCWASPMRGRRSRPRRLSLFECPISVASSPPFALSESLKHTHCLIRTSSKFLSIDSLTSALRSSRAQTPRNDCGLQLQRLVATIAAGAVESGTGRRVSPRRPRADPCSTRHAGMYGMVWTAPSRVSLQTSTESAHRLPVPVGAEEGWSRRGNRECGIS